MHDSVLVACDGKAADCTQEPLLAISKEPSEQLVIMQPLVSACN
jgi:hypothetical protein